MKKLLFVAIIAISSLTSCRNNTPTSEISFSCSRLSSCYSSYNSLVKDPQIKALVENAQKSGNDATCTSAIESLSKSINQQCPF